MAGTTRSVMRIEALSYPLGASYPNALVTSSFLRIEVVPLLFVEEVYYWLIEVHDPLPFASVEIPLEVDHGTGLCTAFGL